MRLQDSISGAEPLTNRRAQKAVRLRQHYARMLMGTEWLIEVPQTLGPAWRVLARPEGKRCLLVATRCVLMSGQHPPAFAVGVRALLCARRAFELYAVGISGSLHRATLAAAVDVHTFAAAC